MVVIWHKLLVVGSTDARLTLRSSSRLKLLKIGHIIAIGWQRRSHDLINHVIVSQYPSAVHIDRLTRIFERRLSALVKQLVVPLIFRLKSD